MYLYKYYCYRLAVVERQQGRSRVAFHLFVSSHQLPKHSLEIWLFACLQTGRSLIRNWILKRIEKWKKKKRRNRVRSNSKTEKKKLLPYSYTRMSYTCIHVVSFFIGNLIDFIAAQNKKKKPRVAYEVDVKSDYIVSHEGKYKMR